MADSDGLVIVSGAAGALGAALARHYANAGRRVLALDLDCDKLGALQAVRILTRACDLANPKAVSNSLDQAIPRDPIALLINAVGLIRSEPVLALQGARFSPHGIESFEHTIRANLTAAFVTASTVAVRMARRGGGAIVNFSSISARGIAGQVAYSAAKAGIEGMTRAMAQELGPLGIRVNAVAPGFIDVPSTRAALPEARLADYSARTPLRRLGTVEDVIAAVENLAANAFVTGIVLDLDGGLRL